MRLPHCIASHVAQWGILPGVEVLNSLQKKGVQPGAVPKGFCHRQRQILLDLEVPFRRILTCE